MELEHSTWRGVVGGIAFYITEQNAMSPFPPLYVTTDDEAPIYRQIVRQIEDCIATGVLRSGEQLPSHRALAARLVVAPLTVKKAYDTLESDGVLETRRGLGTFVAATAARSKRAARERLRATARRLVIEAEVAGLDRSGLAAVLEHERRLLAEERRAHGEAS